MTKEEREERGTVYQSETAEEPHPRSAAGHNALLGLAMFGCFIGAVAGTVPGFYILGGSILMGGLALLTHPSLWRS